MEAPTGFEPVNNGFADRRLTTWLRRPRSDPEGKKMERETGVEPATSTLARWSSTTELLPLKPVTTPSIGGAKRECQPAFRTPRWAPLPGTQQPRFVFPFRYGPPDRILPPGGAFGAGGALPPVDRTVRRVESPPRGTRSEELFVMSVRVLKYGGSSVETPEQILAVARRVLARRALGDRVVVVVSAMGQTTDELVRLAQRVSRTPSRRELDMLLTTGERVSMTLLSMALQSLGCSAISFTGSQGGIVTDSRQGDARIQSVRAFRIREELDRGRVVIVAGFQGVSPEKEVTTLGRGGSDTTAVALAIHLGAARCEIYTDVPGVLSADPRIVPGARLLPEIDYEPMITLSHLGGRVLFRRAVMLARKYRLPVEVLGSREDRPGTRIPRCAGETASAAAPELRNAGALPEEEPMESDRILGVALESPVRWVRVTVPAETPDGRTAPLPSGGTPLFLFFARTLLPGGDTLVQFAVTEDADLDGWLDPNRWGVGASVEVEPQAAVISLVGEGVLACGDMLRRAESILATEDIPIWGLHTGTLSLSILLAERHAEAATRLLHQELVEKA